MVYKTLKKVSDYCQLFIPDDTHTVAGVTITNNGDGSLTIDGTGTGSGNYTNFTTLGKNNMPYKISDKLFISAYVISGTCSFLFAGFSQTGNPNITLENPTEGTYYSGNISTQNKYEIRDCLGFFVGNNTFNNFRVKFNIIDLTEMYGAGNEPTTVEQFRQDFPEELYDYKPYCFVKSYKTLLKVSNYCQLFNKSEYFTTRTALGVTFTNNGDGTITVNGTASNSVQAPLYNDDRYEFNLPVIKNHKYLLIITDIDHNFYFVFGGAESGLGYYEITDKYKIVTSSDTMVGKCYAIIRIPEGVTCNNETVKPQLFDLTEMFGAGNEPTTVEEFREKFPNELYDYKPYSIITSYKKSLVCKTKNLLDANKSSNASSNENLFDTFSINNNVITATSDNSTTKIATLNIFKGELPAGNYILSLNAVIENTPKHNRPNEIFIFKNGSFLTLNNSMPTDGSYSIIIKFTLSEKATISIEWYKSVGSSQETVSDTVYKVTLSNIQLELGDTATEYHPYGYL